MINHKDKIINTYQQTKEHYSKIYLNELKTRVLTRMSHGNFKMSCKEMNASAVFPSLFFFGCLREGSGNLLKIHSNFFDNS